MREMKDSGIEWIGEIPADWEMRKIKQLADPNVENSFVDGDWIESPYIVDSGIRYLTTGNIGDGVFKEQGNGYITLKTFEELACKYAFAGDLIISRLNAPYGRSCILPSNYAEYVVAVDNVILRTQEDKRYICYVSQCDGYKHTVEDDAKGTTMKRISRTNLGNIVMPLPPIQQQHRIADYLDRKCSQIDAIIARQQEVIEKLKAYKLSVITEAVTKGLNPDVPMKDSGVEWIGEIPEHWRLIKLKNIVGISDGTHDTPAYVDISETSHPLVTSKCIANGKIDPSLGNHISQDDYDEINKRSKVHLYDVIMPMIGTVGNPALVLEEPNFAIKNVALLKTRGSLELGKFVLYLLSSNLATVQFDKINRGGVQSFISQEKLKNMIFTLPDSMSEIVVFLDKKIIAIDNVIKQKQTLIDKLVDWKKSLIYEVVTGKKEV